MIIRARDSSYPGLCIHSYVCRNEIPKLMLFDLAFQSEIVFSKLSTIMSTHIRGRRKIEMALSCCIPFWHV